MAAALGSSPPPQWHWFPRDVECDIESLLKRNREHGEPTWLYVRGRRHVGKRTTVRRIGDSLERDAIPFNYVLLIVDDELERLCRDLGKAFPSLRDAADDIERRIRAGEFVAIDEIQEASRSFQQLLQRCIDNIKTSVLVHGVRVTGGLIALGSKPAQADDVLVGAGAPLWQRFESPHTILPFLPYETQALFEHFGVVDSRKKVDILLLTGRYPGALKMLAQADALSNTAALPEMMFALVKSGTEHFNVLKSSEFPDDWVQVAKEAVERKQSPSDVVRNIIGTKDDREPEVLHMLTLLEERYGVIRLVRPILPEPETEPGSKPLQQHYERYDPRWLWVAEVMERHNAARGEQDMLFRITEAHVSRFNTLAGPFMKRMVRQAIAERQRFESPLPFWRPRSSFSEDTATREYWSEKHKPASTPIVLEGGFVDTTAEIDVICVFIPERHVVFMSCKLGAEGLREELRPMGDTAGDTGGAASAAGQGVCEPGATRLAKNVLTLQDAAKRALDPAFADELPVGTRDIVAVLQRPATISLVYVSCGLTDAVAADLVRNGMAANDSEGTNTASWFADFNDIWAFPARYASAMSGSSHATGR